MGNYSQAWIIAGEETLTELIVVTMSEEACELKREE